MIIPTAYLPPVGYMVHIFCVEEVVIEGHETYSKQTYRNHCNIYGPNGKQMLVIPVIRVNGNHTSTKDIRISAHEPWQKIHWRSIQTAYNNSPFFLYYQDEFVPFFTRHYDFLLDFNTDLLLLLLKLTKSTIRVSFSDHFIHGSLLKSREDMVSKKNIYNNSPYFQPFASKSGFISNLSVIDCLFNLGPEAEGYLSSQGVTSYK
ncbi:MAG: WbqC family protein [Saccharofermentanaceae bacterium]|jgi:hypothetical protein